MNAIKLKYDTWLLECKNKFIIELNQYEYGTNVNESMIELKHKI